MPTANAGNGSETTIVRFPLSMRTDENLENFVSLINDPNAKKVVLFGTVYAPEDCNTPLVAAYVDYEIPHVRQFKIVADGDFLTAARPPRDKDVSDLLDVAESLTKIFYSRKSLEITKHLSPAEAFKLMARHEVAPLNGNSREDFFSLLTYAAERKSL